MIVENIGYIKKDRLNELSQRFSVYHTSKKTHVLVINARDESIYLYFPKKDRLPWKLVEGKKICNGNKVFDSDIDNIASIDESMFNNGNQIMAYREYEI